MPPVWTTERQRPNRAGMVLVARASDGFALVDLSANMVENESVAEAIARNIGGKHRDQETSDRTTRNVGRESGATVPTSAAGIGTR